MSFKDTLKKNLTPEMFTSVVDALGDDFDYDMVPRTRLNKVIAQRNEAKAQLEGRSNDSHQDGDSGDGQQDGKKGGQSSDDGSIEEQINQLKAQQAAEIEVLKKSYAVKDKLRTSKAIDPDLILKAGLVDLEKVTFSKDGALEGIDDQISALTKNQGYLFNQDSGDDHKRGTGREGSNGDDGQSTLDAQLEALFGPSEG